MKPIAAVRKALRPLYWRIASTMPLPARRRFLYVCRHWRWPNLTTPVTFTEKVNWRILNDRRPELVQLSDKLAMKDVARGLIPDENVLRIPRTIWSGTDLREAPDLNTIGPWVLKPNNGTGQVIGGPSGQSPESLIETTQTWISSTPGEQLGEWAYTQIEPRMILEERVPGPDNDFPNDYKFYCFDGKPAFIQVNEHRFTKRHLLTMVDPQWRIYEGQQALYTPGTPPRPVLLDRMLEIARTLSRGWDFMRIDLYADDTHVWLSEFTPYPAGGMARMTPRYTDWTMGEEWTVPAVQDVAAR